MVGQVTFWVNQNSRNTLQRSFFKQNDTHTSLPRTGHAGDNGMGCEILWVVISQLVGNNRRFFEIVVISKIKFGGINFHNH